MIMITGWNAAKMLCGLQNIANIMNTILVLTAMLLFMASIVVGFTTSDSWRNTGITWSLLLAGIMLFGIALTL